MAKGGKKKARRRSPFCHIGWRGSSSQMDWRIASMLMYFPWPFTLQRWEAPAPIGNPVPRIVICASWWMHRQYVLYGALECGHLCWHELPADFPFIEVQQYHPQTYGVRGGGLQRCDGPRREEKEEEPPVHTQGLEMGRSEASNEQKSVWSTWRRSSIFCPYVHTPRGPTPLRLFT